MKLTVDTETDSREDLRKVIRFLQHMVNDRDYRNGADRRKIEETKTDVTNMAAFFSSVETTGAEETPSESPPPKKPDPSFKLDFF